jgi:hypothetical protein
MGAALARQWVKFRNVHCVLHPDANGTDRYHFYLPQNSSSSFAAMDATHPDVVELLRQARPCRTRGSALPRRRTFVYPCGDTAARQCGRAGSVGRGRLPWVSGTALCVACCTAPAART